MKHRRTIFAVILVALRPFGFLPLTTAVVPTPDGGYPGGNTAEGQNSLFNLTSGTNNTAIGFVSLRSDTSGSYNTAVGAGTLFVNTGDLNTATGFGALLSNTIGTRNTANGALALFSNTQGDGNTACGYEALLSNNMGFSNTANGASSLFSNTNGNYNTATGANALLGNTHGDSNTAVGYGVLDQNTIGSTNTAIGSSALGNNTTGDGNNALGADALVSNTTGDFNVAIGELAGLNLTTGNNNIDIGYNVVGLAGESNTIRIGNSDIADTFIRGISGATASGGAAVFVNANGKLGTMTSSSRFKEDIKPIGGASDALFLLRPVAFRYKKEIDPKGVPQFGLVAEEVAKVNSDLVIRDAQGKPQTVRYEQINAMLLNEFLKEHRTVQELKSEIAALNATVREQASQIHKVSAQLGTQQPALQTVAKNSIE